MPEAHPSSPPNRYLIPGAVVLGCALIAAALYATRSSPAVEPAPAISSAAAPAENPNNAALFRDLWKPHAAEGATRCRLAERVKLGPEVALIEIPLELKIAADGRIEDAHPDGAPRVFGAGGGMRQDPTAPELAPCYAAAARELVRFPAGSPVASLKVGLLALANP
jgi:hypothetical protein